MIGLYSTHYVFNKILFDFSKEYHKATPEPELEQALVLLTSDILLYHLHKIPETPLSRRILEKKTGLISGRL